LVVLINGGVLSKGGKELQQLSVGIGVVGGPGWGGRVSSFRTQGWTSGERSWTGGGQTTVDWQWRKTGPWKCQPEHWRELSWAGGQCNGILEEGPCRDGNLDWAFVIKAGSGLAKEVLCQQDQAPHHKGTKQIMPSIFVGAVAGGSHDLDSELSHQAAQGTVGGQPALQDQLMAL